MKTHRHAKGTDAHVTADRSDGAGRRPRNTKPMSEGGSRPNIAPCKDCGEDVIHHKLAGGMPILLDTPELQHGDHGARYVIVFGFVCVDPIPAHVVGLPWRRKHACKPSTEAR